MADSSLAVRSSHGAALAPPPREIASRKNSVSKSQATEIEERILGAIRAERADESIGCGSTQSVHREPAPSDQCASGTAMSSSMLGRSVISLRRLCDRPSVEPFPYPVAGTRIANGMSRWRFNA
jgi:hypothetical protein